MEIALGNATVVTATDDAGSDGGGRSNSSSVGGDSEHSAALKESVTDLVARLGERETAVEELNRVISARDADVSRLTHRVGSSQMKWLFLFLCLLF